MNVQVGWLKDFIAVMDSGGFSKAAERRHVTQPAISRHILALETWIGTKLFERSTHSVAATPAGLAFKPIAEDILQRIETGREVALETAFSTSESVQFASTHALSQTFFPKWIKRVQSEEDGLVVQLFAANLAICERMLVDGEVQFLLAYSHRGMAERTLTNRFQSLTLGEELVVPVSAPMEPGGTRPRFQLPGSAESPLAHLTYHPGSGLGRITGHHLATLPDPPELTQAFVGPATLLVEMARDGLGMTWAPMVLVEQDLKEGRLVRAGDCRFDIPIEIKLFRPKARLRSSAERFWALANRQFTAAKLTHPPS
ncbi:MAG: DNA-binding transcriptional regulator, LysR family [Devosia sp.]|nr:DNA-binding transcriptional regulator, LysR family [Devosia sp.]